ncbi:MAG: RecQ family ATP-dependent DNA helicase [Candidatus Kapaibacteriota bacterium]
MTTRLDRARSVLRSTFGYDDFRTGQRDIIDAVLHGRDVLGVMPTGGGKSLCFQVPALVLPPCTLVISPLVALMTDQVARLQHHGVAAAAVHSGMSQGDINNIMFQAHQGKIQLLYVAPERLESATFRGQLSTVPIQLLAIDEAHCISEWGHDFRPSYRSIAALFEHRPRVPMVALTATATADVRSDIIRTLQMRDAVQVIRGFDRTNLAFQVVTTPHKTETIARYCLQHPDHTVLVYAGSRRRVDTLATELEKRGIAAAAYHAGKAPSQRTEIQDRFLRNDVRVLVATNAFGMGIDKSDVRAVFHADLTLTLEAYYQEAGRAGRDAQPATCTLLYQPEDRGLMDFFVQATYPESPTILAVLHALYDRARVGVGGLSTEVIQADAPSLAADLHLPLAQVSGVLSLLERSGVILLTGASGRSALRLRTTHERFDEFIANAPAERKAALEVLQRILAGASMEHTVHFDARAVFRKTAVTPNELAEALHALHTARLLKYVPAETEGGVVLLRPRPPRGVLPIDADDLALRRAHAVKKLQQMIAYAETPACKRNSILQYFGDPDVHGTCGRCSSCTTPHSVPAPVINTELLVGVVRAVHEVGGRFGRNVIADIVTGSVSARIMEYGLATATTWGVAARHERGEILRVIDAAVAGGHLTRTPGDYPTLAVTASGEALARPLPRSLRLAKRAGSADSEVLQALLSWRERTAQTSDVSASSILSYQALEALATDCPGSIAELQAGTHGSGLALARYGEQIVAVVTGIRRTRINAIPAVRIDAETEHVLASLRPDDSVIDVARRLRLTPATVARMIQRGIEAGSDVQRWNLVPNDVFSVVMAYLRDHRYAKLRHVVERIREEHGSDADLPTLRIAMAFARRELYGGLSS